MDTASTTKGDFGTPVLSFELATDAVTQWLDFKKVKPSKREKQEDTIQELVEAFQTGQLILNEEDHSITMHLIFPVGNNLKELKFKPRISPADKKPYMKKVPAGDMRATIIANIGALTGQASGMIEKLDIEDYEVAGAIALFFL